MPARCQCCRAQTCAPEWLQVGDLDTLRALCDIAGASLNAHDSNGATVMHYAVLLKAVSTPSVWWPWQCLPQTCAGCSLMDRLL